MKITTFILLLIAALCGAVQSQSQPQLTKTDIDKWMTELSNWGRWGKTDELGAINLITPAKRKQAFALVKDGTTVSLARLTNTENAPDNQQPYTHEMTMSGESGQGQWSIDRIGVSSLL